MNIKNKKRIIILGCAGSGKSTLAKELGEKLNIDVFHLDKIFYKPNWEEEDKQVFIDKQKEIISLDKWIIDGNYRNTLDLRLAKCDLIIYLDYNRLVSIHGIYKRYKKYKGVQRDTIATGCYEKLDKDFIKWAWQFKKKAKPILFEKINQHQDIDLVVFKTRRKLKKWIKNNL